MDNSYRLTVVLLLFALCSPLAAHGNDVVFYGSELPPFMHSSPDGRLCGFAVDLLREVAKNSGGAIPEPEFRQVPWARALFECRHDPRCALVCMAMIPSRKREFKWVGPIARVPLGVYARKSSGITISKLEDLLGYRVGVIRGSAPDRILAETPGLEDIKLEQVNSTRSAILMLQAGRLELTIQSEPGFIFLLQYMKIPRAEFVKVFDLEPVSLYYSFHRAFDDGYVDRLQAGLEALQAGEVGVPGRYEELCRTYWPQGGLLECLDHCPVEGPRITAAD